MKTQMTEQELNFYNALYENQLEYESKSSNDYFLNIIFNSIAIKGKSINEINFPYDIQNKVIFLKDSILLLEAQNGIYIGKIDKCFWLMDEYENIYFISKNMIDITNVLLTINSNLLIKDDINDFYELNQIQVDNGNFKKYLEDFKEFSKKYGYDFDLMKDMNNDEWIEEYLEEFNKILESYGIVNEEE